MAESRSEQVSFRLAADAAKLLDQVRGEDSRGEFARRVVVSALGGGDVASLREALEKLEESVSAGLRDVSEQQGALQQQARKAARDLEQLREDFATAVVAILVAGGAGIDQVVAEKWARDHLLYNRKDS